MTGRGEPIVAATAPVDSDVLVVDDDALVLMLVERRLRNSGLTLKVCASGSEALDYLGEARVRLLLVDLHMSPMDGIEFLETLDARNLRGSARTLIATSAMPDASVRECMDRLDVGLVMKTDVVAAGGIARLLDDAWNENSDDTGLEVGLSCDRSPDSLPPKRPEPDAIHARRAVRTTPGSRCRASIEGAGRGAA